jgi:hypothetical protein
MAIDFPTSPAAGDTYTYNGRSWRYNAQGGWERVGATRYVTAADLATAIPAFGMDAPINLGLAASVESNALTIAVKGADGNDPSAANPVLIPFRSATAATGTPVIRSLTAATSLVISSGSTLGTANSTAFRLWIVLFDDGGTLRLGAIKTLSGTNTYPLRDDVIASSTAEGGAGAADSAHVIYTGTAASAKALRVLGYMDWSSGLGTAGTWSAGPTKIQLYGPGVSLPGAIVQVVHNASGAVATGTTTIPFDDTIPQNTEGTEFLTQAITPTAAANVLQIDSQLHLSPTTAGIVAIAALFQDSTANALAVTHVYDSNVTSLLFNNLRHRMLAATASATTFKMRGGPHSAATVTFNGQSGNRFYGGTMASYLSVQEIMA